MPSNYFVSRPLRPSLALLVSILVGTLAVPAAQAIPAESITAEEESVSIAIEDQSENQPVDDLVDDSSVDESLDDAPPAFPAVADATELEEVETASTETTELDASADATQPSTIDLENFPTAESTVPTSWDLGSINFEDSLSQVTSVNQLSDVQPTDWAYQALQSLVERYGCIAGYPDGTFRGNQAITRYEMAAALNSCLDRLNEIFSSGLSEFATREDLLTLQRLQEEFAAELAELSGQVDDLEARAAYLEATQFSTTTKLFGQVVMGLQSRNDYEFTSFLDELENDSEPNLITNVQLSFLTQFNSRSLLLVGLQAGDGSTSTGTPGLDTFTRLGYEGDNDFDVQLSDLSFRHLIGRDLALIVGPEGVNAVNTFRGVNRVESAGFGPLSRFAQRNPILSIGAGTGGVGLDWQVANWVSLQAVYSTSTPADPENAGLFGGDNGVTTIGTQLVLSPARTVDVSFQYINSYSPFGRLFTGVGDDQLVAIDGATGRAPIQTNAFGANVEWRVTPYVTAGGWAGYTISDLLGDSGTVETFNWMAYLNFPDLLAEGNLGALYFGQPPKIVESDLPTGRNIPSLINEADFLAQEGGQPDTAFHVEALYRWRLNDNISLTPGVIVVFNPGHNADNETVVIGALRTTFTF